LADRSHNDIEKIKATKNNQFQHPHTIKQSLGDTLGGIIINLIPKDEMIRLIENRRVPPNFEVTSKNVLSENMTIPVDTNADTMALYTKTIRKYFVPNRLINVYCFYIL